VLQIMQQILEPVLKLCRAICIFSIGPHPVYSSLFPDF
jgi:hypothetical protein